MKKTTETAIAEAEATAAKTVKLIEALPKRGKLEAEQETEAKGLVWACQRATKALVDERKDAKNIDDRKAITAAIDSLADTRNALGKLLVRGRNVSSVWLARETGNPFGYFG